MRVSLHSNLMREQTQLQQPRLHPWHLETSDLCISWTDLVPSRLICTEVTAVRNELSQHNHRSSSIGRDCSKKSQAPHSDKVAQNLDQSDSWNPPKTDPPGSVPLFQCLTYITGKWFSKYPNGTIPASLYTPCFFALSKCSPGKSLALISQQTSPKLWKVVLGALSLLMSRVTSSALPAPSEAPCYEMCWVTPIPYAQLSTATWQPGFFPVTAAMPPCPSSSRDSSQLRTCDEWLWRALEATQNQKKA